MGRNYTRQEAIDLIDSILTTVTHELQWQEQHREGGEISELEWYLENNVQALQELYKKIDIKKELADTDNKCIAAILNKCIPVATLFKLVNVPQDGFYIVENAYETMDNTIYYDDWGKPSLDPHVITGKNMGEPELPQIDIIIEYSGKINLKGAALGTLSVYHISSKDIEYGSKGKLMLTVPIVSGSKNNPPAPKGKWNNLEQVLTATSSNAILKNNAHGGPENIMIRLPGTNGDAIHQGNNASIQDTAYTDGCIGVTAVSSNLVDGETEVEINYKAFKNAINPYGYQGVRVNVEIK